MRLVDRIKTRLHRDIVADPVLHGLVLNLYLNGEQYPHRVADYFPFAAVEEPELERAMRAHVADEDKHIALYERAIRKLGQPVSVHPLPEVFNEVIRRHTPTSFALAAGDSRDQSRHKLANFFAHLHFLEKRVARSLEYHVEACAQAASDYPAKAVGAVLRDEHRHVSYTREVVAQLVPRQVEVDILTVHACAERRANLEFSARQLGGLARQHAARFPRARGRLYSACAGLLRGMHALA
jgi:hypothetical protein